MFKSLTNIFFETTNLCFLCREKQGELDHFICKTCYENLDIMDKELKLESSYISHAYHSIFYNKFARERLREYKFHGKNYLYKPFGHLMIRTMEKNNIEGIDLIFYVPSHRKKEAKRGYNQSELLGKYISETLNIPLSRGNLIKVKKTKDQNKLSRVERLYNLEGSFFLRNRDQVVGKKILLVDDIMTTGSTMEECAKLLFNSGAREIIALSLTTSKN